MRRYKGRWAWGILMLLATNLAAMAMPQLFRYAVDGMHGGAPVSDLYDIAITLLVVALAGAVFRVQSRVHIFYAARDVEMDLRLGYYRHLTSLEPSFFHGQTVGDLMSRATNDITQVRLLVGPGLLNVVNTVFAYATALAPMLLISPELTLWSLAAYPPAVLLVRRLGRLMYLRNRAVQDELGRLSESVQESLVGAQVVRAFASEGERTRAFEAHNRAYHDANNRLSWVRSGLFRLMGSVANLSVLVAVYLGTRQVLAHTLSVGELVALVEYMALLAWPTLSLGWMLSLWQRGRAAMGRINEVMDRKPAVRSGPLTPLALSPHLELRGLSLTLDGRQLLDGVSLRIEAGQLVGIVGPIGAGKSLLVQALLRLIEVPSGQVFVGGHPVTDLALDTLRRTFGYVPQQHMLFSKTLAENVAFGRPDASDDAVRAAVAAAALTPDLAALPQGLETPVGERGITLSGGQKQRTAMARALLVDPPILILDDALASVDAETEATILHNLRRARAGKTTLIVTHRPSAVRQADFIVVMDRGCIVEQGSHAALMRRGGLYARLARRQELANEVEAPSPALVSAP